MTEPRQAPSASQLSMEFVRLPMKAGQVSNQPTILVFKLTTFLTKVESNNI